MRAKGIAPSSLVIVGFCAILLAGCGGSKSSETASSTGDTIAQMAIEKAVESAAAKEGVDLNIDTKSGKVVVQGQDGSTTYAYGGEVKLPENAPADLPLYPGMLLLGAVSDTQDENFQYMIMAETSDSTEKVQTFFKTQFPEKGWKNAIEEEIRQMMPDMLNMLSYSKDGRVAVVVISEENGKTLITIQGGKE